MWVSSFLVYASCLDDKTLYYSSSSLMFISFLPIYSNSTLTGLLNSIIAALDNPVLTSVDLIWIKSKWTSLLVCLHVLMVWLTNIMHASTCWLLWWWYWWCYNLVYIQVSAKILKSLWNKIHVCIWNHVWFQQIQPKLLVSSLWLTGSPPLMTRNLL